MHESDANTSFVLNLMKFRRDLRRRFSGPLLLIGHRASTRYLISASKPRRFTLCPRHKINEAESRHTLDVSDRSLHKHDDRKPVFVAGERIRESGRKSY
jgi:hypothetical protein